MKPLLVNQSGWGHILVTGADRLRFIQGMCTGDVKTLPAGGWVRASMLSPKGRVTSVVDIIKRDDDLILHCEPALGEKTLALLRRYAVMDEVELSAIELAVHRVWPDPAAVWSAPPVLSPPPGPAASPDEVEVRRIEAGYPRYGVDVSEDDFPFESMLGDAIDYAKGCYIGQEPVARAHSRGHANRALRGLRGEGEGALPVGAVVSHPARPEAGAVTSAAVSPDFGSIALAYLHKSAWEPGARVEVAGRAALVSELPFR